MAESLEDLGFKVYPSDCNYLLFKSKKDTQLFEKFLDMGILIRDCENIPGLSKGYYRISIKPHEENVRFLDASI